MAKKSGGIRLASSRELTWFQQNDQRNAQLLRSVLTKVGAARFAGLDPVTRGIIEEYLDQLSAPEKNKLRRMNPMQAGVRPFRLPTQAMVTSFKADLFNGDHETGDVYKIALYLAATTIGPGTTAYTATNEVANGSGYTTGGATLAGRQVVTDGTTVILDWTTDPVWAGASFTARGALIYNDTNADKAMGVFDFGADITATNGNFTVTLPAPTAAAGLFRL